MSDRTKAPQPVLLGEHSAIRLVGLAWSVYVKNYPAILVIFSAMFLPFAILTLLISRVLPLAEAIVSALFTFGYFVAFGPLTFTVSDICLGNKPTVKRSYDKYFRDRLWLRVVATLCLSYIYFFLGFVIVIMITLAAGVSLLALFHMNEISFMTVYLAIFGVFYLALIYYILRIQFIQSISIIERRWANDAIRRSLTLSRGDFWRVFVVTAINFVIVLILSSVGYAIIILIGLATGFSLNFLSDFLIVSVGQGGYARPFTTIVDGIVQLTIVPVTVILNVILYYDLRVRREAYDVRALYEDMMR
jgi:hypothetical protein